ncbi:sigma-70 family RNA polymerase sigma factor [Chitinophaga horti]|uniref:Sigma-70 family RNA polymerase sigma factor n=1 Tax=Chitinophaga horti TaxID=2920382 RepID=A0ABY6J398_9BACT|nr:sigma-70 family RNA polymerase sigma factor [Chitinophaga horti]UYQ94144.1 sigma-70 family RNA polymerase sigma factor [Chitinophaga horti]
MLSRTAGGDEYAFRELMLAYQPLLLTYVYQLTRSESHTEEIVQDVFLKIWMGREALEGVHRFKNYLFIICRNYALDQLRKLVRERELAAEWETEQEHTAAGSPADTDEQVYTLLDEAVNHLPPQQQKVYLMARRQGLPHAEIARQTGLSVLTVKKYMKLAIAAITEYIRSRLPGVSLVWIAMLTGLDIIFKKISGAMAPRPLFFRLY